MDSFGVLCDKSLGDLKQWSLAVNRDTRECSRILRESRVTEDDSWEIVVQLENLWTCRETYKKKIDNIEGLLTELSKEIVQVIKRMPTHLKEGSSW